MTFVLDCESGEIALSSIAKGYSCSMNTLEEALLSYDVEMKYEEYKLKHPSPYELTHYKVIRDLIGQHDALKSVCWFHGTRTSPDNNFSDGILPLNLSLEKVWDMLLQLAPDCFVADKLFEMYKNEVPNRLYKLRTKNCSHWGPYAIMVRDVAFHATELGQHDYLRTSELVEDICNAYQASYGEALHSYYDQVLQPKLIKFQSSKRIDLHCINTALGYCYTYVRGIAPDEGAITVLDNEGSVITQEQIMLIETFEHLKK